MKLLKQAADTFMLGSVTTERVFSRFKIICSRLRLCMGAENRRDLVMCSFNRMITMKIPVDELVDEIRKIRIESNISKQEL